VTFPFHDTVPVATGTVSVAFTDRRLDLGDRAPDAVRAEGLAELAATTGATPYLMHQVHGTTVHEVTAPDGFPDADALVSAEPGVALVARVADCVPVLLVADSGEIGAVHAGREGVRRGVVPAAVERLRGLGATSLRAWWVGPHICGRCYEVPEEMRADVAARVPEAFAETSWGTPVVDVGAGVVAQLRAADVDVVDAARCTLEDERLFSHRGHDRGRLAGLVWVRP